MWLLHNGAVYDGVYCLDKSVAALRGIVRWCLLFGKKYPCTTGLCIIVFTVYIKVLLHYGIVYDGVQIKVSLHYGPVYDGV